jgi:hypothetical protein
MDTTNEAVDYGLMIFADRWTRQTKQITEMDIAVLRCRTIAQPVDQDALKQVLLTLEEVQQTIPSANNSDGVEVVESCKIVHSLHCDH